VIGLGAMRVTVRSNLPRLWQWIEPSYGVLGVEPANCSVTSCSNFTDPNAPKVTDGCVKS